jgi:5'-3' exoribonuclease 1
MGIPGFFAWLINKYDKKNFIIESFDKKINNLYIDANCLFHPQCFKVLEENKMENNMEKLEKDMRDRIIEYIAYLIKYTNPQQLIYISVDGVAPLAKINQQRYRRYKTWDDTDIRNKIKKKYNMCATNWSNMVITPGTIFMELLHKEIINFININKDKYPKIIYSSYHTPGEGEHKILQHMKKENNDKIVIYGLDADLFFLSFASKIDNIYLLREESEFKKTGMRNKFDKLVYISIDNIKNFFNKYIKERLIDINLESIDFNGDIIFICYFLGNDFLPHLPSINIKKNGLDVIMDAYIVCFNKFKTNLINKEINMLFLTKFIKILANIENKYFKLVIDKKKEKKPNFTNDYEEEIFKLDNLKFEIDNPIKLGYDKEYLWKYRYYEHYFYISHNMELIDEICNEYVQGIMWVLNYYFMQCDDWMWFYSYSHAPFLSDIYNYIIKFNVNLNNIVFKKTNFITPFIQLLAVIPPNNNIIIPESYRYKMTDSSSDIIDLFPLGIEQDMIYKDQSWNCIPIIPYLDIDRIIYSVKNIKIINKENIRNIIFDDLIFE